MEDLKCGVGRMDPESRILGFGLRVYCRVGRDTWFFGHSSYKRVRSTYGFFGYLTEITLLDVFAIWMMSRVLDFGPGTILKLYTATLGQNPELYALEPKSPTPKP